MATMEQATLGQYFPTRRKGLEGVHPAKRRKVDGTDTEGAVADVTVRRSARVKKRIASSTQTKDARTHKGARRRAKESPSEESVETSCNSGIKTVSEPTSLFDDHAFAEAFIGKLSESQRKRKMAPPMQIEDTVVRTVSKDTIAHENVPAMREIGDEANSKTKNRRQMERFKQCGQAAGTTIPQEITSSETNLKSSSDRISLNAGSTTEKGKEATSKTPPIVRRIDGGIKANPWIAEQAKIVLSRGRAAVKISQNKPCNPKNMEDQLLASSKNDSSSGHSQVIAPKVQPSTPLRPALPPADNESDRSPMGNEVIETCVAPRKVKAVQTTLGGEHSRYRFAVKLLPFFFTKEELSTSNTEGSHGKQVVKNCKSDAGHGIASKAQEDLVKARDLIKTMKSLKKRSSRCQSSTMEEQQQRLHQVALSPLKQNDKTASQSTKEAPAFERFHTLAQPSPSEDSSFSLPLPYKYKALAEMFRCTDTVLNLLGQRKEKCTFTKLRDAVQQMSRKRFEKRQLAQIKAVYPSSLEFRQDKSAGKSSVFELTIEFGRGEKSHNKLTLTATELLARRDVFQKNLLRLTKKHHQSFLQNLNPSVSVDDEKIIRWHPKFRVDNVPDIGEAELPQPPVVKTYNSAHDVLEKARDMIAPRVEKALRTVAKDNDDKESKVEMKDTNLTENKTSRTAGNSPIKNNKNDSALKGISQDLLNKIRQKQARKIEESMMRDPIVDKKLAMKERLPELCRILKAYFSAERKAAIPLEDATVKLSESYKTSLSPVQVEEHIRFMSQLLPEWISVLMVRKCSYIKINKTADVNNVINKLMTKEIH